MKNNNKLGNPAVIAAIASTPQAQRAINTSLERVSNASANTVSIVKNILLIGIFGFFSYKVYQKFFNNFSSLSQHPRYEPAKITDATARAKAESIYRAMYGFGNGFNTVFMNLKGTSHNDFVKIYNAFGNRSSAIPMSPEKNLIEWITGGEFNNVELIKLRSERPDFF